MQCSVQVQPKWHVNECSVQLRMPAWFRAWPDFLPSFAHVHVLLYTHHFYYWVFMMKMNLWGFYFKFFKYRFFSNSPNTFSQDWVFTLLSAGSVLIVFFSSAYFWTSVCFICYIWQFMSVCVYRVRNLNTYSTNYSYNLLSACGPLELYSFGVYTNLSRAPVWDTTQ